MMRHLVLCSLVALVLVGSAAANNAVTNYVTDSTRGEVYFYVYRVHNVLKPLADDNAASAGGEVGFLTQEYGYTDGIILRDCVTMKLDEFAPYECCNGGSCSSCSSDSGSGTGTDPNMPGRAFQIYPPTGSPCPNPVSTCSSVPGSGSPCQGECVGWWYSFPSAGKCAQGDSIGTNGCTWHSSDLVQSVQYADLIKQKSFKSSITNDWSNFQSDVDILANAFASNMVTMHKLQGNTYTATTSSGFATPYNRCQTVNIGGDGDGDGDGSFAATTDDRATTNKQPSGNSPVPFIIGGALAAAVVVAVVLGVVFKRRHSRALTLTDVPMENI